jgi:hypothetical protein
MKNISTLRNDGGRLTSIERILISSWRARTRGMAAAVQAARCGMKVALVNDRAAWVGT